MKLPQIPEELLEFYPAMSAQNHEAHIKEYARKVAIQARSEAFDESAKVADGYAVEPDPDEQDPWDEWEMGNRSAAKRISQAIRQHSQKGRDNE